MKPAYCDKMSELLDAIIEARRKQAVGYQEYLAKLLDAARKIGTQESNHAYSSWADNGAKRALIDFFFPNEHLALAIEVDTVVRHQTRLAGREPDEGTARPTRHQEDSSR